MGASQVHVHGGPLRASAEEARLREDGNAGEPLLSDAEPALHRRLALPGPQRPVVGGRRGEVPGVDIGCGVGRAQGCVSSAHGLSVPAARPRRASTSLGPVGRGGPHDR